MICPDDFRKIDKEWRDDRTCHFCGSVHPDDFMEATLNGTQLSATDKRYKVYVMGGPRGMQKFYFVHLSEAQKTEFVELYNNQVAQVNFYVLPFFMKTK
jgi:hypothetical protein